MTPNNNSSPSASVARKQPSPIQRRVQLPRVVRNLFGNWRYFWPLSIRIKVVVLILGCIVIWSLKIRYFGQRGALQGGLLGRFVDNFLRTLHYRDTLQRRNHRLAQYGYQNLPPLTEPNVNKRGLPVLTQSYLAEVLIRTSQRRRRQDAAANLVSQSPYVGIPPWILQPIAGDWFHSWEDAGGFDVIQFAESEMQGLLRNRFPTLLPFFDDTTQSLKDRILLWSVCALYYYGGHFVSSDINNFTAFQHSLELPSDLSNSTESAVTVLARTNFSNKVVNDVILLAATPRHPLLRCAIHTLETQINSTFNRSLEPVSDVIARVTGANMLENSFIWFRQTYDTESAPNVCPKLGKPLLFVDDASKRKDRPYFVVKLLRNENSKETRSYTAREARVLIDVNEHTGTSSPEFTAKQPIAQLLDQASCESGWLCNRCLKTPWFGSFQSCSAVCNSCYEKILCQQHGGAVHQKKKVLIDVHVREQRKLQPGEKLIPRIIHQTWFDQISPDRHPQFVRFQNSWKSSGWEYRFYSDDDVREYISSNFPSRFLAAFDALIPGAFKADVFRLVVLLKEGGIYVDVDVKLDANLDSFITPSMSFLVPRDLVAEPGEYCLWNGIIGAAPGHPLIAAALERMLNAVLNRADYHDVEREMCQKSPSGRATEIWKIRALPVVLLTGPCALGISINTALGSESLVSKIDIGWMVPNRTRIQNYGLFGDMFVLLADKYDMGEMRFTDVERNRLFASTNQNLMLTGAIEFVNGPPPVVTAKPKAHYSTTVGQSGDVFGARAVYADNQVTNENIILKVINHAAKPSTKHSDFET